MPCVFMVHSMSIWIALALITLTATLWEVAVVMQKKAADRLPLIKGFRGILSLIRSPLWILGLVLTGLGWGIYVYALNFTPLSIARAITASGYVILAVLSMIFLKHRLRIVEWLAIAVVTAGVVMIGASEEAAAEKVVRLDWLKLVISGAVTAALSAGFVVFSRVSKGTLKPAVAFAAVSGILSGFGDLLTKGLLIEVGFKSYMTAFAVYAPLIIVFYLAGFFALSRSYQHGTAVSAVVISDFTVRLSTAVLGIYALGEGLPHDPLHLVLRVSGFTLALSASVLLGRFSGEGVARSDTTVDRGKGTSK